VGGPVGVVMKRKPQKGEGKSDEQEQGEFSLHRLIRAPTGAAEQKARENLKPMGAAYSYTEKGRIMQGRPGRGVSSVLYRQDSGVPAARSKRPPLTFAKGSPRSNSELAPTHYVGAPSAQTSEFVHPPFQTRWGEACTAPSALSGCREAPA